MTQQELRKKMEEIRGREAETPSEADRKAIEAAMEEDSVSLQAFKDELEGYSGRIVLRIPRSLHKQLKEAAAAEGVSLNQYMLYKLSRV